MQRVSQAEMEALPASPALRPAVSRSRIRRWLLIAAGMLLVGIGVLGIFLPLLPTTVFFLGAAACFGKSSPGAYRWLTENRFFGRYLNDYSVLHGATVGAKVVSITSLWLGLGVTGYLLRDYVFVEVILGLVGAGVTWHLLALRTLHRGDR